MQLCKRDIGNNDDDDDGGGGGEDEDSKGRDHDNNEDKEAEGLGLQPSRIIVQVSVILAPTVLRTSTSGINTEAMKNPTTNVLVIMLVAGPGRDPKPQAITCFQKTGKKQ